MWKTKGNVRKKNKNKKKQASCDHFPIRNVFLLHEIVLPPRPGGCPDILVFTSASHLITARYTWGFCDNFKHIKNNKEQIHTSKFKKLTDTATIVSHKDKNSSTLRGKD